MTFINMNEKEILDIIEPIMDNCLEGSNEANHQEHTRDFTDRMKNIVTPENLKTQLSHIPGLILPKENLFICLGEISLLVLFGSNPYLPRMMN